MLVVCLKRVNYGFWYLLGCKPRGTPYKSNGGACHVVLSGLKMKVWYLFRVFSFKKYSVVAFVVPLRVEIRKRFMTVLFKTFKKGKSVIELT